MGRETKSIIFTVATTVTGIMMTTVTAFGGSMGWKTENGNSFWYENDVKQGTYDDAYGVIGDGVIRDREIYDPVSDGWYWLDACYDGY